MIVALFLAQAVVGPAGPNTVAEPATGWRCSYVSAKGETFELSGVFPEAPVGWDGNRALSTTVDGNGPAIFLGKKSVNSYRARGAKRPYQVSFLDPAGDRYNLNFEFAEQGETPADITHWQAKEKRLATYAKGVCTADFNPAKSSAL